MAREVLSNGVINPDKYQADWYADLSNNWNLLNNLIGSAISSSEVDSKIATAVAELMVRTFQIVTELPVTGTEGVMYLVLIPDTSKYTAYVWENSAYRELGVIQMTITIDDELSTTSENPAQNKVITNALNNKAPISHTHSASDITSGLATVATSGSYNDLSNKPTIPTVNDATLTIQKNGTTVNTFTANASSNVTANITVPTKTSDLTNDSGFITEDNTKIPLAGSNQISGSLIPATDNSIDIGSSAKNIKMLYTKGITIDGTQFLPSDYIPRSGGAVLTGETFARNVDDDFLVLIGGSAYNLGAYLELRGKNNSTAPGKITLACRKSDGTAVTLDLQPNGTAKWNNKNVAMREDTVPRSGGAVLTGSILGKSTNDGELRLCGCTDYNNGASVVLYGKDIGDANFRGKIFMNLSNGSISKNMNMFPNGTWTWNGTACQITSDQRYKQQIAEIDDKLLDAWEDVDLVQFKYNDAVKEKSDNARLHTGYVVQQIDEACKSHNVDISAYGLYCHEEYPEETEEVEVEQADGTKVKETKVIREASEHYSLRYTEALIVECAYLRKCIKELRTEIEQLKSSK